jgi:hypothetical protein
MGGYHRAYCTALTILFFFLEHIFILAKWLRHTTPTTRFHRRIELKLIRDPQELRDILGPFQELHLIPTLVLRLAREN